MQPALLLILVPFALGWTTTAPPPIFTVACTLGGEPCPTGSICTQTETCGGLCLTSQTFPPEIPCTVGNNGPCPTGSTCTPTMACSPTPTACGGACIATAPAITAPQPPTPTIPCVVGADDCPSGSFCTQTTICGGLCISTAASLPTTTAHLCGGHHKPHCPDKFKCVRQHGKDCGPDHRCHSICIPKQEHGY